MKNVLLLGASGNIGPYIAEGLEADYRLRLADIVPHRKGKPLIAVDVTQYHEVLEASRGMDAIINCTVIRSDPVLSFRVNTIGSYHVMKAAAENGIRKVVNTGPEDVRNGYRHDFDIVDVPPTPGTNLYRLTKYLGMEICKIYARTYGIQTICFCFNGLGPKPTAPVANRDFPPFTVVWEDLQHACRLALEVESVPDDFQMFNIMSYYGHGRHRLDKVKQILGYAPLERLERLFARDE